MLLNCDLGESYGNWTMGLDAEVMPFIDQANIACGFHAGDPLTMQRTLDLAREHGVQVGAHPAYPDLVGCGRRSMTLSADELLASLHYQVAALVGMARNCGVEVAYVKPHGALYNDMMAKPEVRAAVMRALSACHRPLPLMLQATGDAGAHREEARCAGIDLLFEAFADRCYDDSGRLVARSQPGAVHDRERMLAQVRQLLDDASVTTASSKRLPVCADSLCVHGDNPEGVRAIEDIRELVRQSRR